ncbi:MAG TPA: alpha-isopropylmalate synthase regulatory domain-containing protein, partial [Solirubrobacteraceae bacterium]|nr:alpha-isopropylmalate synthase regulatory domain-containing protein [Solirubrobacteraceae bacterium]
NTQSGKGGVAYVMRAEHDLNLPRLLQIEFTRIVQREVDASGREITPEQLLKLFRREYMTHRDVTLVNHVVTSDDSGHHSSLEATLRHHHRPVGVQGEGNGAIAAFVNALEGLLRVRIRVRDYAQQTLSDGTDAKAISYVKLSIGDDTTWGVGEDTDTAKANFDAILAALTRVPHAWDAIAERSSEAAPEEIRPLRIEFRRVVQPLLDQPHPDPVAELVDYTLSPGHLPESRRPEEADQPDEPAPPCRLACTLRVGESRVSIAGEGNGAIAAFVDALRAWLDVDVEVLEYAQQTLEEGARACAISYMWVSVAGHRCAGVGKHTDTVTANLTALLRALDRAPEAVRAMRERSSQLDVPAAT